MRIVRYVLPMLLMAGSVFAQTESTWYLNKPIADITFDGLDTVRENELSGIVDPFIGETFTEPTFLELQRRLYALDYFEEIIPNAMRPDDGSEDRVILRFDVVERPVITEIEIEGNDNIGRNRILDVVLLTEGDMVTRSKRRIDEEAIRGLYLERGYPDVEVTSEFKEEEDGENIVTFTISEGNQITIDTISFVGNEFATDSALRGEIELRERSLFKKGVFEAAELEQDQDRIRRFYNQEGYIDAEVVDVDQQIRTDEDDESVNLMDITFFIEEGEQYTYGGVTFDGNTIFEDEELHSLIRLQEGEILDLTRFDLGYQRVADRYFESGYIFNQITREEIRDEATNTVSFRIDIVERNRAHIENIVFRGNEKTKDFVIEREIPLEVGDVFSATRIREGLQNLANLQYFSAIAPETPPGSAEGLMDLIINLEEGNTAEIVFGVAFGGNQEFPVSAQVQWQDQNFLGRGQTFGIQGTASPITQTLSFNFLERWLFGRRWSGGLNLSFERSVISNIPQDAIAPIYEDDDEAVPDPFDADRYVFTETTEVNGTTYKPGDTFPGVPSGSDIDDYDLVPEYEYLGNSTANIPDEYLMSYDAYTIGLGANTGYTFRTPVGRLVPSTSIRTNVDYITYDDTLYRPFNETTRDNLNQWRFRNSWSLGLALDARDYVYSPSSGYRLDQGLTFVGGFLFGERHYSRTDTTAEVFFTLWDIPLGEWAWKMVLGAQSKLSMIWPNFYLDSDNERYFSTTTANLLRIDGMFNSRGWGYQQGGASLWNNWIELRMPLAEQVIWWDSFLEGAVLRTFTDGSGSNFEERELLRDTELQDWQFTIGTGIRFVIPQFPIRLYLAKRFKYDESGNVEWQTGNLFNDGDPTSGKGVDLVFTIGAEFF